jgi:hypothetical protein
MFGTADLRTATLSSDECHEIVAVEVAPYREVSFTHLFSDFCAFRYKRFEHICEYRENWQMESRTFITGA